MRKWHEKKIMLRVGVFSSSREISARLVEVERQPEGDEQDEEGAYANREREGKAMEKQNSARKRVMLKVS